MRMFAVFASPAASVDPAINILRPYSRDRWLFRFQTVDETAACGRLCLCDLEVAVDIEHFGGSLGSLASAAARFADSVADASGECIVNLCCYVPRALWKWRVRANVLDACLCRSLLSVWGFPLCVWLWYRRTTKQLPPCVLRFYFLCRLQRRCLWPIPPCVGMLWDPECIYVARHTCIYVVRPVASLRRVLGM